MERVTIFCFAASYGVALMLELGQLHHVAPGAATPGPLLRGGGVARAHVLPLNHTFYLTEPQQKLLLESPLGSLLFLAWILTVFYLYGSIHHQRFAWGLFVLPLVLGLILIGVLLPPATSPAGVREASCSTYRRAFLDFAPRPFAAVRGRGHLHRFPGQRHVSCASASAAGQGAAHARHEDVQPGTDRSDESTGHPLGLSAFDRGAARWPGALPLQEWTNPKILSAVGLWVVFAILLYLRYSVHVRGLQVALLTVFSFVLLVLAWSGPTRLTEPEWKGTALTSRARKEAIPYGRGLWLRCKEGPP